jgi:hypothetical protein
VHSLVELRSTKTEDLGLYLDKPLRSRNTMTNKRILTLLHIYLGMRKKTQQRPAIAVSCCFFTLKLCTTSRSDRNFFQYFWNKIFCTGTVSIMTRVLKSAFFKAFQVV